MLMWNFEMNHSTNYGKVVITDVDADGFNLLLHQIGELFGFVDNVVLL